MKLTSLLAFALSAAAATPAAAERISNDVLSAPVPAGYRPATEADVKTAPNIKPLLAAKALVFLEKKPLGKKPATILVVTAPLPDFPPITADSCRALAEQSADREGAKLRKSYVTALSYGPTCFLDVDGEGHKMRSALAVVDGRLWSVIASHGPQNNAAAAAWSEVVQGLSRNK